MSYTAAQVAVSREIWSAESRSRRGRPRGQVGRADCSSLLVRMPYVLREYLESEADRRGVTLTALIQEAIAEHALVRMK